VFVEDVFELTLEDAVSLALDLWTFDREQAGDPARRIRLRPGAGSDGRLLGIDVIDIVGPDMPFIVSSAIAAMNEARIEIRAVMHPVLKVGGDARSLVQLHIPSLPDARRAEVVASLEAAMRDVRLATADHAAMRDRMSETIRSLAALPPAAGSPEDIAEAREFLQSLLDGAYIFLGVRDYLFPDTRPGEPPPEPTIVERSGLGVLRDVERRVLSRAAEPTVLTPEIRAFLEEPQPVIVAKASVRSRVHRNAYCDYVGVKAYDQTGKVVGERRFLGLFTSEAYTSAADTLPLIRRKIARVKQAFSQESRFSARQLDAVLKTFPRDELFQASVEDLARVARGALHLQIRPRTRLFIRRDRFDRYVSALLYTPRDSYTSDLRVRAHRLLAEAYGGRASAFYPWFGEGPLTRVHFIIGVSPGHPEPDEDQLDLRIRQLFESWEEALRRHARSHGVQIPSATFTAAYREAFAPEEGLNDLAAISGMAPHQGLAVRAWGAETDIAVARIKIYHRETPLSLSRIVPVLERMGLAVTSEFSYPIRLDGVAVHVHDIAAERPRGQKRLGGLFEQAFEAVWAGETENDGFNSLVVALGVDWRRAALFRTLCRYRSQTGLDPSEAVQIQALRDHPDIALGLLKLFETRFDPALGQDLIAREKSAGPIAQQIDAALKQVASLDADRVLRRLTNLIQSLQRTNFFRRDAEGRPERHIAIKIASRGVDPLPAPRPFREIFVWAPDVEGVHLRFGPVARGGLRWSDRRDDFRAEVLGLVKAQNVKNAVIVPVGAKGGFYPRNLPVGAPRERIDAMGVAAYKTFVGAMLDLTDNLVGGAPVRPAGVVAWDGDDPYLVVAADKGTATFSDIANGLSGDRGFWLGDAFASGGSAGYDHKKMGITARGAWIAVQRHFRELGHDVQTQPFSVIGVGDMSGDVFGNGMLLSKVIRLVAAFDHRHIFIDPEPQDLDKSWTERKRLFEKPRSSWADYDPALISKGGGVFERSLKSIPLTDEIRKLTGLAGEAVAPSELMRALLTAKTDLLWFGGIGAYIKASVESHADVADKANDAIRVNGREVQARVIAEGANLGVTQAGRIEYARAGGRINTDAIDNSAGVASSDREVNIKILLSDAIEAGDLRREDRDALLASMTDEVASLVLEDNYAQTGALTIFEYSAPADLGAHEQFVDLFEADNRLDRKVEGLPSKEAFRTLREKGLGLTRPELAVIMAYAKLDLFGDIVASRAPDDPAFQALLQGYFPTPLTRFSGSRARHRLRREIIATRLANRLVNLAGPAYAEEMRGQGVEAGRLVLAFETAYAAFLFDDLFDRINALDGRAPADAQTLMAAETASNLRLTASALVNDAAVASARSIEDVIARYRARVAGARGLLPEAASPFVLSRVEARAARYRSAGSPDDIARDVAMVRALASVREASDVADRTGWSLKAALFVHHAVGEQLGLDQMRAAARDLSPADVWEKMALGRVADDLPLRQSEIAALAIAEAKTAGVDPEKITRELAHAHVRDWLARQSLAASRLARSAPVGEGSGPWSLAKLVLMGDAVREFVYALRTEPAPAGPAA
jgi:glutamate dehydrogenase